MNEFKRYRLIETHRAFDDALNESVQTYAPVLQESIEQLSEAVQNWNRFVLQEELTPDEITKIFTSLSDTRGATDPGMKFKAGVAADEMGVKAKELQQKASAMMDKAKTATGATKEKMIAKAKELQAKAKEAGGKVMDKGKQLAGAAKEQFTKIKSSMDSAVSKAKGMIPDEIAQKLQQGGQAAQEATEFVGQKVDGAVSTAKSALSKSPAGQKIVGVVDQIGTYAKENPMKAAMALAAISALTGAAIGTAGMGAAGGGVVSFVSRVAMNMVKGEDAASAAKKAAKSGVLGAATGGLGGALADYLGGLFGDVDAGDVAGDVAGDGGKSWDDMSDEEKQAARDKNNAERAEKRDQLRKQMSHGEALDTLQTNFVDDPEEAIQDLVATGQDSNKLANAIYNGRELAKLMGIEPDNLKSWRDSDFDRLELYAQKGLSDAMGKSSFGFSDIQGYLEDNGAAPVEASSALDLARYDLESDDFGDYSDEEVQQHYAQNKEQFDREAAQSQAEYDAKADKITGADDLPADHPDNQAKPTESVRAGIATKLSESVVPQQRTRNHELDRIRELAGLPPLNEGPKMDALKGGMKKAFRGGKDLAQSGAQKWSGKKSLSVEQLQAKWQEAGSPTDEQEFMKFLKGIGVTDKEIRTAMSAVPGSDTQLDPKSQARLEKIVALVNKLDIKDDIQSYLATQDIETTESLIYEEIDFPTNQLDDRTVLKVFQSLEKQLPNLKQAGQEEPEAEEPAAEEPASNDYTQKGATNVAPTNVSMNGQQVTQTEAIKIINKLVERQTLGRMRK